MQVCVIKNQEPKNSSIPLMTVAGGVTGLAIRQFLPAQQNEIDTFLFNQSDTLKRSSINNTIKDFMQNIKQQHQKDSNNLVLDLFIKRREAKDFNSLKLAKLSIKNSSEEVKNRISKLRTELATKILASRQLSQSTIENATKQARPIWAFLLPGMAIGALSAYIYNVIGTIKD